MSLVKGRQCSESVFEYLNIELVHSYARQSQIPSAAAIEAIGEYCSGPARTLFARLSVSGCQQGWHGHLLHASGYRVGRQLIEKYMFNRPQLKDSLDIIRFICKEFWGDLFKKQVPSLQHRSLVCMYGAWMCTSKPMVAPRELSASQSPTIQERASCRSIICTAATEKNPVPMPCWQVDNLRTNHRGTFVLSDRNFRWLSKISGGQGPGGAAQPPPLELARDFLHLPCALLRGALTQLGMDCNVTVDCANFPAADFTISPRQA